VNSVIAFVALLVLSYFGGLLSSHRISRALGLASGVEYVLLGVVVGPQALGFFRLDMVLGFEPLLLMALGWLAAVLGIQYGHYGGERVPLKVVFMGLSIIALSGAGIFSAVYFGCVLWLKLPAATALPLALGSAAVASGSAHQAVRWATGGESRANSLSRLLGGIGSVDDLLPFMLLAAFVVIAPVEQQAAQPAWVRPLLGIGLGVVLGATVAALLGPKLHRSEFWSVLLGAVLLVVGLALQLEIPLLTPVFLLGLTLALLSPHRRVIRQLVIETERPVLVPSLLLIGALVELPQTRSEWCVVGIALAARLLLQFTLGATVSLFDRSLRGSGRILGQSLLSIGGASLAIGLTVFFRHPGQIGRVVLFVAVSATLIGELLGGRALRRIALAEQALFEQELKVAG